jgi:hypothetical protein
MEYVDPRFPLFVLLGVLVGRIYYNRRLVCRVQTFKRLHCPNASVVLHSRDIRRRAGEFAFLGESDDTRLAFYEGINELFGGLRIRLFASVIDKRRLRKRFIGVVNPYEISISQLLSLVCGPPGRPGPWRPTVSAVLAEARGKAPDRLLQAEYAKFHRGGLWNYGDRRVQNRRATTVRRLFPERIEFVRKTDGESGLELADLAAYPIARAILNRNWNRPDSRAVGAKLEAMVTFPVCDEEVFFPWHCSR